MTDINREYGKQKSGEKDNANRPEYDKKVDKQEILDNNNKDAKKNK